jgi:hypothetical protein
MQASAPRITRAAGSTIRPVDYDRMRMLRFRAALLAFLRRWGAYLLIGLLAFSAQTNAPLAIAAGLASMLVQPLWAAAARGWMIAPVVIAYALVGALPIVATRPLWWPRRWADAERALPLAPALLRASDRRFAAWLMAPWQGILLLGFVGIVLFDDGARDPMHTGTAIVALIAASTGSALLSMRWMRHVRARSIPARRAIVAPTRDAGAARIVTVGAYHALVWLPLVRGRAKRTVFGLAAALACDAAFAGQAPSDVVPVAWSFALVALASSIATSWLRATSAGDLEPLWRLNRHLPLDARACDRARLFVVLVPMLGGLVACAVCALTTSSALRVGAVVAYVFAVVSACLLEAKTSAACQPHDHAARWILMVAIAVACASEVAIG